MAKKEKSPPSKPISALSLAPVPLVAVGAAAGGLEAFSELLKELPPSTGLAFVYLQAHVGGIDTATLLTTLGAVTARPVQEAQPGTLLAPDQVYVLASGRELEVSDQEFTAAESLDEVPVSMPIDSFFFALAERQREGIIGVLLSGAGTDGAQGLKAIKAAGGITFTQDTTALYQEMPKAAIGEGAVDRVLPPLEIARELVRLSKRLEAFRLEEGVEVENTRAEEDLKTIIQLLRRVLGVDFSHYKMTTIRRRIIRRMLLYKLETLKDYAEYLRQDPTEAHVLYNDLLINVTSFFRDPETMDHVKKVLLPQIIKSKAAREPIRIWVPACSTGQEAYSLAMLLLEALGDRAAHVPIQIFATDLSQSVINKARQGSYSSSEIVGVSPRRLQRFFSKIDDQYRISKSLLDLCVFAQHNLLKDPPFSRLDMISCRNLLIYLDDVFQQKAFSIFHYALNPNGTLLLGNSESVGNAVALFSQVDKAYKAYIRKNDVSSKGAFNITPHARDVARPKQFDYLRLASKVTEPVNDLDRLVDGILLSQYVPASVVVDQDLEILQFRGSTGLYLEPSPGKASLNLLKMARSSLVFELRNTIHKARKTGKPVRKAGLEIKDRDATTHQVAIEVVPLRNQGEQFLYLVLFEEMPPSFVSDTKSTTVGNRRIKELEEELAAVREDMHSIIEEQEASNEELQSANEEIVSSSEELQSINEELETSKEEIESTNEELLTINQELQQRNDQLTEAYSYAEAIFDTIREATLILDKDLRIKSANRAFYQMYRADRLEIEGKLIYEVGNGQWNIQRLRELLENTITDNSPVTGFEVSHTFPFIGEKVMRLNARKVIYQHRQEVILLAIEDITEHRLAQRLLEEREAWFRTIADHAPTMIWVANEEGRYNYLNQAWLNYTGRTLEEEMGHGWAQGIHPDDWLGYLSIYNAKFLLRQPFQTEYRLRRHDGEYRWMLENAKPTFLHDGTFSGYMGTCVDVQLQKELNQELDRRVRERTEELHQANRELKHSHDEVAQVVSRLQSVLNGVPAAITLMEALYDSTTREPVDFNTAVFNQSALELLGRTAEDIQARTMLEAHPETRESGVFDMYMEVLRTGVSAYREINLRPVGSEQERCYALFVTQQVNENGVVSTLLDITDRKDAEQQVQLTAENLQAVLDSSPAAIGYFKAIRDKEKLIKEFRLMVCNDKFARLKEKPVSELIGKTATQLANKLWQEKTFENVLGVLETGQPFYEERQLQSEGEVKWLGLSLTRHDSGVVLNGLDITTLKKAEIQHDQWLLELKRSDKTMQSLERMRQYVQHRAELLRAASHDLRGSFGVVVVAASLLDMLDSEEERTQTLTTLQRSVRQVTQMLNQLLDHSRLEAGEEEPQLTTFDVAKILRELGENVTLLANEKHLKMVLEGPEHLLIRGDVIKIHRIAQNLILNAIKYTSRGSIEVSWGPTEGVMEKGAEVPTTSSWFLVVKDSGPGMPELVKNKLLDKPYSTQETATDEAEATSTANQAELDTQITTGEGIGLFIVKRLCDMLGAKMEIETEAERGTLFRIHFPRQYEED
ncbi:hypothetical protein GCM10027275_23580 [Rhabdobacter roseus]|uniref:Two-component system CheB/CheR fusion protein n=1 Tax=Rhabdobacter roseus TaxID=1655419 RepID=A0A840TVW9_9BACT|nr:CheR family methyltransferase [Rhabdobacter roseus]MBB5284298.1 two-component system CheB/CheR fusion protein [Rhabdobacter roseus]